MVTQDVKYLFFLVEELVADLAGRALFYGAAHASERGCGQRQGLVLDQVDVKHQAALADQELAVGEFQDFKPFVGGEAVFLSAEQNRTDRTVKMRSGKGNIGHGKHDAAGGLRLLVGPGTLGPYVPGGKGAAPVFFDVAETAVKVQLFPV